MRKPMDPPDSNDLVKLEKLETECYDDHGDAASESDGNASITSDSYGFVYQKHYHSKPVSLLPPANDDDEDVLKSEDLMLDQFEDEDASSMSSLEQRISKARETLEEDHKMGPSPSSSRITVNVSTEKAEEQKLIHTEEADANQKFQAAPLGNMEDDQECPSISNVTFDGSISTASIYTTLLETRTDTVSKKEKGNGPPKGKEYHVSGSGWSEENYFCAAILAFTLLGVIGGLVYLYLHISSDNNQNEVSVPRHNNIFDLTFKPTQQAPVTTAPTTRPSISPTHLPTRPSTPGPTLSKSNYFKEIMGDISEDILDSIQVSGSAQQRAYEWLIQDPNFYEYGEKRIIQRWALSIFSISMQYTPNTAMETWMEYTDECTWFTSWYENRLACDSSNTFKFLVLKYIELDGSLPSELMLLSKLDTLILSHNKIEGTMPELGGLTSLNHFDVQDNRLIGRIPDSIKDMSDLTHLNLRDNYLTGSISNDVCVKNMLVLEADCEDLFCSCCTNCQSQYAPPTLPPDSSPDCQDEVKVSKSCYTRGEDIYAEFINCNPRTYDWIGVYDADDNIDGLYEPLLWHWNCGSQRCKGSPFQGSVILNESAEEASTWPLDSGTYRVWIFRIGSGAPYPSFAQSQIITVTDDFCL